MSIGRLLEPLLVDCIECLGAFDACEDDIDLVPFLDGGIDVCCIHQGHVNVVEEDLVLLHMAQCHVSSYPREHSHTSHALGLITQRAQPPIVCGAWGTSPAALPLWPLLCGMQKEHE